MIYVMFLIIQTKIKTKMGVGQGPKKYYKQDQEGCRSIKPKHSRMSVAAVMQSGPYAGPKIY